MIDTMSYPWIGKDFFDNQAKLTAEDMKPYAGFFIAWSWDGTRVLASGQSELEVYDKLIEQGADINRVVYDYIDPL